MGEGACAPQGDAMPQGVKYRDGRGVVPLAWLPVRSTAGQPQMTRGLTDAESTAQLKELDEFADVVLVERIMRLKIGHFAPAIAGVSQQRSGAGGRRLGAMTGGAAHRTR